MVLVALDLDGTALDSNGRLSQSVAEAIRQRAKSKKYIFAFVLDVRFQECCLMLKQWE